MSGAPQRFPLDSSAIVHLGSKSAHYTNTFRLTAVLTEPVEPLTLQKAVDHTAPRFPTLVAGIRRGAFQYWVVPAVLPPAVTPDTGCLTVTPDTGCLTVMPDTMLRHCALRVLYRGNAVSVEMFHSLTDGYGGLAFLTALLTEYAALRWGTAAPPVCAPRPGELRDDYLTYASKPSVSLDRRPSCRLPGGRASGQPIATVTEPYDLSQMLALARRCGVTLTALLAAVMAQAISELPGLPSLQERPIRLMIPADLRRKFPSESLRNFSLYALPTVGAADLALPLPDLAGSISRQLTEQLAPQRLTGVMYTSTWLQTVWAARCMPLAMKERILRTGCALFGERCSCLTLSNLGEVALPDAVQPHVQQIELALRPRRSSPYNCGVVSYRGTLAVTFSCRGAAQALPPLFFQKCRDLLPD